MTAAELETTLCLAYHEQADCYARLLILVEALPEAFRVADPAEEALRQAQALLAQTQELEAAAAPAKQAWQRLGQTPGPELSTALQRVGQALERLLTCIAQAEQAAATNKDRLAPQLDVLARGRQMQQAYGGRRRPA
jgi:acyl-CoA reductase-like NAD-dependent aldehyde dehydrogenase